VLTAVEVLALQLEVGLLRIAVRRVFPDEIRDGKVRAAAEGKVGQIARRVELRGDASAGPRSEIRQARAPTVACADVAAHVGEDRRRAGAIAIAVVAREVDAVPYLGAQLDEGLGRRDPFQLYAVLCELTAEERLVRERRVDEVPDVLMLLVEIADPRKEPAELRHDAVRQRGHEAVRLLDLDGVVRRQRDDEIGRELVIDVGADRKL